jgi:serine phosphatase RsbU (regulator of sigma subunit)
MMVGLQVSFAQSLPESSRQKAEQYQKQISTYRSNGNKRKQLEYLNKLAFLYWNNKHYGQAATNFQKSLDINQSLGNQNGVKRTHYYLGMIFSESGQYNQAIGQFEKGLALSRQLNMKNSRLSGQLNLAQTYQLMEKHEISNEHAQKALSLAKELNDLKQIRRSYGLLSENFKKLGNSEESIKYFDLFSTIDQHMKNQQISDIKKESENQISQARSEKQQTEQQLAEEIDKRKMTEDSLDRVERITREQQMQLEMKELENKKIQAQLKLERTIRNSFIIGFILFAGFSLLLYHFYRQKKKANVMLETQNHKINQQNLQIQQQKNKLQLQNTKLNDSLTYAENIQHAILPVKSQLNQVFNTFILYRPKDIVSGDFYWYTQVNGKELTHPLTFLAVVDCTGHGVPGAFMSMIGNRIFNEIISEKRVLDPAQILYHLNDYIVEVLKQERTDNTDGMDVCLIRMEHHNQPVKEIRYAGARRPLYYFRQSKGEIEKLKGDRYSIGGINKNKKQKEFHSQKLNLENGDLMYLTTDGIFDQVNDNSKRFSSRRFLQIINHNIHQPMEFQGKRLEEELICFKGESEQRDDITVVGVKII